MVTRLTYAILDDEPPALEVMLHLMANFSEFENVGAWTDPDTALAALKTDIPSLLFLDVEMPSMTGLEFLKRLPSKPVTALVTAYPEYAVDAFALGVRDYILKPVSLGRVETAIENIKPLFKAETDNTSAGKFLPFKDGHGQQFHAPNDIISITAVGNFSELSLTHDRVALVSEPLRGLCERLLPFGFVRIHKSHAVNIEHIAKVKAVRVELTDGKALPVGRTYQSDLGAILKKRA